MTVECGHLSCDEQSILRLDNVLSQSGDYVFQIKAKAKKENTIIQLYIGDSVSDINLTTEFQYTVITYENLNVNNKYIEIGFPIGDYWFYNLQLETGNKPTAWSLCLDDLIDTINLHTTWIEQTDQQLGLYARRNDIDIAKAEMKITADGMISEALKSYTSTDNFNNYKTETSTKFEQTDDKFGLYVTKEIYNGLDKTVENLKEKQEKYFQFDTKGLTIGEKNNPYQVVISNETYQMLSNGNPLMSIEYGELTIPNVIIKEQLRLLGYTFNLDSKNNLNCQYAGG